MSGARPLHFCVSEDRPGDAAGLELLLRSLLEHAPGATIRVTCPAPGEARRAWLVGCPRITLRTEPLRGAYGWNVKPHALLEAMDAGADEVIWIDADIIATGPLAPLLAGAAPETVVVGEECYWGQHQGGTHRTAAWGLRVGRALPATANTGVLRVTRAHRDLLEHWRELLESPEYREVQGRPALERPIHMVGDQEVFTALLGAEEHARLPLRFLRRGVDIAQNFGPGGYTVAERLGGLVRGAPPLVHAMGRKPWRFTRAYHPLREPRAFYDALAAELSVYRAAAARHRRDLRVDAAWLDRSTLLGRALRAAALGHPLLAGLPQAAFDEIARALRSRLGLERYAVAGPAPLRARRATAGGSTPIERAGPVAQPRTSARAQVVSSAGSGGVGSTE